MDGKSQAAAAAASDMSLRTAREWDTGPLPSAIRQVRDWRTRPDPFAAVWRTDVEPLLGRDVKGVLEAKLVLEVLRTRYPDQFHAGQACTLRDAFATGARAAGSSPRSSYRELLRLNPNDNQGVRYLLVAVFLEHNAFRLSRHCDVTCRCREIG